LLAFPAAATFHSFLIIFPERKISQAYYKTLFIPSAVRDPEVIELFPGIKQQLTCK
jgi:hypothetical protein